MSAIAMNAQQKTRLITAECVLLCQIDTLSVISEEVKFLCGCLSRWVLPQDLSNIVNACSAQSSGALRDGVGNISMTSLQKVQLHSVPELVVIPLQKVLLYSGKSPVGILP